MDLNLKRGDTNYFVISQDESLHVAGQTIVFMAKPDYDNDQSNQAALITKVINDSDIVKRADGRVYYQVKLNPEDTADINIKVKKGKKAVLELKGELEIKTPEGEITTLPSTNSPIKVKIYPDIKGGV